MCPRPSRRGGARRRKAATVGHDDKAVGPVMESRDDPANRVASWRVEEVDEDDDHTRGSTDLSVVAHHV